MSRLQDICFHEMMMKATKYLNLLERITEFIKKEDKNLYKKVMKIIKETDA